MKLKLKEKLRSFKNEKVSPMLLILIAISTVAMLVANIIAAKTFTLFSIGDMQIVLPCAVIVFPITYILSDVFSEVYGYKWSRRAAWISFAMNLFMVMIFEIAIVMPGATDLSVLKSTWFLLLASLVAYMVGDLMNDLIFRRLKAKHGEKHFVVRAMLSSLCGEFCDSLIYIPLGMLLLPKLFLGFSFMTWAQVGICVVLQPLFKVAYELVISPLTYFLSRKLKQVEKNADNTYDL